LKTRIPIAICSTAVLLCAIGTLSAISSAPEGLVVYLDGDYLRVALPHVDFLKGKPLDRLKDGASVAFIGQITITTSPNSISPAARSVARFALSYDIWEERFSVTKIGQSPESRRSQSHLSVQGVENWCLDNLVIDRSQIPTERDFYVQLDLRAEDPKDQLGIIGDPGINLTRLIEIFGRAPRSPQGRWLFNSGPFRLGDLKKTEIRGIRG
jgi:hypothetical protein